MICHPSTIAENLPLIPLTEPHKNKFMTKHKQKVLIYNLSEPLYIIFDWASPLTPKGQRD